MFRFFIEQILNGTLVKIFHFTIKGIVGHDSLIVRQHPKYASTRTYKSYN